MELIQLEMSDVTAWNECNFKCRYIGTGLWSVYQSWKQRKVYPTLSYRYVPHI